MILTHRGSPVLQRWQKATWGPCTRTDRAARRRSAGARLPATRTGPTRVSWLVPTAIIQASSHPIKFTRKHTFNHFHAWFLFVQTFCSSLKVEIFKPVFPQGDKYFNLSLPPVFSTCCFPLKLHLISELYLLMSYCTKLVIFQKTRPFLVSSQWLWFQRAENISLVFSC